MGRLGQETAYVGMKLGESPSREEVLKFLFNSSCYGNLGLFIGAGFTKAIFSTEKKNIALSWGELLEAAAKEMGVDLTKLKGDGVSYPELASLLCDTHAKKKG